MTQPREGVGTVAPLELAAAGACAQAEVGGKALRLGVLSGQGLPVPPGFVVGAAAFRALARGLALEPLLDDAGAALGPLSREVAARCAAAPWPAGVTDAVEAGLAALPPGPVAVRSSAADEDDLLASAAGQYRTVLGVSGREAVLEAIRACWASAWSEAALTYRRDAGRPLQPEGMAVIVQSLVEPQAAGVLFSRGPGAEGPRLLVEAVAGRGDRLVDGVADPVRYLPGPGGRLERQGAGPALLTDAQLERLQGLAREVEAVLGPDLDLEWALAQGRLFLLQARPITREARAGGAGRVRWTAANTQEALLDPVTPLTWSLFEPLVERGRAALFRWAGLEEIPGAYMRLFAGRPYFNPDYFRAFLRQIPGAPENVFDALIFGEGSPEVRFQLPPPSVRALRLGFLYLVGRFAARERFELFRRVFAARLRRLDRARLEDLSDEALLELRRRATDLLEGALHRHVLGTAISGAGYTLLDLFLEQSGAARAFPGRLVARLVAGAPGNALAEAGTRLEELAREAARRPALVAALPGLIEPGWQATLESVGPDGRWLRGRLERFLARHGHRCEKEAELAEPRWGDDPGVPLAVFGSLVRAAAGLGGLRHQRQRESDLAREAAALADQVSAWLASRGLRQRLVPLERVSFRFLLREARRYAPYRENLKDCALRAIHLVRRTFLEAGRRLAARGLLERADEVFFLEVAELEAALRGRAPVDLPARVAARRGERAASLTEPPARYVIDVPGLPPRAVSGEERSGRLLEGMGASGGRVVGVARVLRSTEEAQRLGPGEIIVARVVNAGWTPLFHLAGGIVAEVGGVLSHAAIVAREYGIPAVFGVAGASSIADGARICVDGDRGIVTLEGQPDGGP